MEELYFHSFGDLVTLEGKINLTVTKLLGQNLYSTGRTLRQQGRVARVCCSRVCNYEYHLPFSGWHRSGSWIQC